MPRLPAAGRRFGIAAGVVLPALVALALTLPSLKRGLAADDHFHRAMLTESPVTIPGTGNLLLAEEDEKGLAAAMRGLFAFITPGVTRPMKETGGIPWWSADDLRVSFFRPVTAATHWLDYRLWPERPSLMHLQGLLWFAALAAAAAALYRRLLGPGTAALLAALLFAADDAHLVPATWIANRNALVAALFALLALAAHDRRRREGWRPGGYLAAGLFALALLSAEAGAALAGYLAAYALFLDPGKPRERLLSLVPAAAVLAGWRVVYQFGGFGAWGSGFYVDPGREPLRYLATAIESLPVLLFGQWGWPDPVLYNLLARPERYYWAAGTSLALLAGLLLLRPLLRRDPRARFFAAGTLLSLLPACAAVAVDGRLLLFAGFGAMGLAAVAVHGAFAASPRPRRRLARAAALLFLGLHLVAAPVSLAAWAARPNPAEAYIAQLTALPPGSGGAGRTVVVANAPCAFFLTYLPFLPRPAGDPLPDRLRVLAPGYFPLELVREDERTLLLRPAGGFLPPPGTYPADGPKGERRGLDAVYYCQLLDSLFRGPGERFSPGERTVFPDVTFEVVETERGRPTAVRARFAMPLESPSLVWVRWEAASGVYRAFTPPPPGEGLRLGAAGTEPL